MVLAIKPTPASIINKNTIDGAAKRIPISYILEPPVAIDCPANVESSPIPSGII